MQSAALAIHFQTMARYNAVANQRLYTAREREDARIVEFMSTLDESFLQTEVCYVNSAGKNCADTAPLLLAHFFNHQTHHRAQIQMMLSQTPVKPPSLDLHRIIRP